MKEDQRSLNLILFRKNPVGPEEHVLGDFHSTTLKQY